MLHHRTAEEKKLARLLEEVTGLGDEYDPKAEVHDDDNHPSVVRACLPYLDGSNAVIVSGKTSGPIRSSLKRHNSALSPPSTSTVGEFCFFCIGGGSCVNVGLDVLRQTVGSRQQASCSVAYVNPCRGQ